MAQCGHSQARPSAAREEGQPREGQSQGEEGQRQGEEGLCLREEGQSRGGEEGQSRGEEGQSRGEEGQSRGEEGQPRGELQGGGGQAEQGEADKPEQGGQLGERAQLWQGKQLVWEHILQSRLENCWRAFKCSHFVMEKSFVF